MNLYVNGFINQKLWSKRPLTLNPKNLKQFGGLGLRHPYPGLTVYVAESYHEIAVWTAGIQLGQAQSYPKKYITLKE